MKTLEENNTTKYHLITICIRGKIMFYQKFLYQHFVWLFYRDYEWNIGETLYNLGINEETVLYFSLSSFHENAPDNTEFCHSDITPSVKQTDKGISLFFSALYAIVSFLNILYAQLNINLS